MGLGSARSEVIPELRDLPEFLLDYEEEDDENGSGRKSKKKKPWRLRWPDDFRDEVLARLLELNEQRHKEEALTGKAGSAATKGNKKPNAKNNPKNAPAVGPKSERPHFCGL